MAIALDERSVVARLAAAMDEPLFRRALTNVTSDRLLLSLFLMGVSYGEGLGEAGVAAIGEEEIAALMRDLPRQGLEEHGHMEGTLLVAQELFPDLFEDGRYRFAEHAFGLDYYFTVREANRRRLRGRDRYSRLNLYLTTSFGYEVMVELLYGRVIAALDASALPRAVTERVRFVLTMILRQEETHLGLVAQHNALLAADRTALSPAARATLDRLALLTAADYEWAADLAVRELVAAWAPYADAAAVRARLGAAGAA